MEWMALWMEWLTVAFTSCRGQTTPGASLLRCPLNYWNAWGQNEMGCEGDGPVAWGRAASARRWRRSPWARTPGRAARRWLWRCTWRRWRWPACRRTAPACDARPGRCRSLTWTWRCSAKRGRGAKGRNKQLFSAIKGCLGHFLFLICSDSP